MLTLFLQDAQGQETTVDIDIAGEKVETHKPQASFPGPTLCGLGTRLETHMDYFT